VRRLEELERLAATGDAPAGGALRDLVPRHTPDERWSTTAAAAAGLGG
jgi:hypothetical protein